MLKAVALAIALTLSVGMKAHASVSRCVIADLSVSLGTDVSPTTGAHPISLRLVNQGRPRCTLNGYPLVVLRDAKGVIPFVYRHAGDMMVTSRPPTRVTLRSGRSAYVLLDKFRCDLGSRRTSRSIQIGLEGSSARSRPITLTGMRVSLCKPGIASEGRVVYVSPFEPTLRATFHG
jgi:Protein of unknown function (DUF4232)